MVRRKLSSNWVKRALEEVEKARSMEVDLGREGREGGGRGRTNGGVRARFGAPTLFERVGKK
jgi:hypothetical protein